MVCEERYLMGYLGLILVDVGNWFFFEDWEFCLEYVFFRLE